VRRPFARVARSEERPDILRCTLQGLPELLLAKRLPGEQRQDRPEAA